MNLDMQTVSKESLSGIFLQCKLYKSFSVIKYKIVISLFSLYIQYLFKFSITVFKMPLYSGRFPREHAKYTVVLENTASCQQTFCW